MVKWRAYLSDGSIITEGEDGWGIIPEERLPWPRLCVFLEANNLHLTNLELDVDGQTETLPISNTKPDSFSVQYIIELNDVLGNREPVEWVEIAAHYEKLDCSIKLLYNEKLGCVLKETEFTKPIVRSPII